MKNIIYAAVIIGALLGSAAFAGYSPFLKTVINQFGTTSGSATTQHIAEFAFNPTTASATSTSVLNADGQDRVVRGVDVACSGVGTSKTAYTGAGLATLTFTAATSSTASPAALSNTNYTLNVTVPTSTTDVYVSTSTSSGVNSATGNSMRWQSGSYMTVASNATNTAACIVSVSYLQGLGI